MSFHESVQLDIGFVETVVGWAKPEDDGADASLEDKVAAAIDVLQAQIRAGRHLVVACSFGKDSSVTLALALLALRGLRAAGGPVPTLHVMHSDTLVENPVVHAYAQGEIQALRSYAAREGLPVKIWVSSPSLSNNYLVNLIGGREIASMPDNAAKCQQQMKAAPLERVKRRILAEVRATLGADFRPERLVTLIGTRRDESAVRGRAMARRGESALEPVNLLADRGGTHWVLSPIADFTTMDVFEFLGNVTSGLIKTYSDFRALTAVYRDSAAGECMVNLYAAGRSQGRTACGARHGCWICTRVQSDRSMENLLAEGSGKYAWMQPLSDFRNYLKARHYDPSARNWLSRTVDARTGRIKIAANSYAPDFTLELLRYALSIDADEATWSLHTGQPRRFQLLRAQDILGIDLLWGRYSYQEPFTAVREYRAIYEEGRRYRVPTDTPVFAPSALNTAYQDWAPFGDSLFADPAYEGMFEGLRSLSHATAEAESLVDRDGVFYTDARTGLEFEIDEEAAELFFQFEIDHALAYYGPYQGVAPSQTVHHLTNLGIVQIHQGGHREWDRMLRVGNQIHRYALRPFLNDPVALGRRLRTLTAAAPVDTVSSRENTAYAQSH